MKEWVLRPCEKHSIVLEHSWQRHWHQTLEVQQETTDGRDERKAITNSRKEVSIMMEVVRSGCLKHYEVNFKMDAAVNQGQKQVCIVAY